MNGWPGGFSPVSSRKRPNQPYVGNAPVATKGIVQTAIYHHLLLRGSKPRRWARPMVRAFPKLDRHSGPPPSFRRRPESRNPIPKPIVYPQNSPLTPTRADTPGLSKVRPSFRPSTVIPAKAGIQKPYPQAHCLSPKLPTNPYPCRWVKIIPAQVAGPQHTVLWWRRWDEQQTTPPHQAGRRAGRCYQRWI